MLPSSLQGGRCRRLLALAVGLALAGAASAEPIKVAELRAAASLSLDAEGIPLIKAQNELDLAFLQGYAHARDRFFQMDFSRRGASGTVAELVGQAALANDVQTRTLGLRRAAWATWQAASDDTRGWLKAYADGVNYWLRTTPSLPPEYQALEISQVEPWSPVDSVVIGKALAFQLSFDLDIQTTLELGGYQQAGQAGGFDGAALYFGDTHRFAPPDNRITTAQTPAASLDPKSLQEQAKAASVPLIDAQTLALAQAYRDKIADHPLIGPHLKPREGRAGSNEWVVAGSMTQSGKAILANDPHLSLALPSTFVEQHLSASTTPALNVTGVTVAGAPGVIQGCNDRLCWGTTTNPLDVTDVFQETLVLNSYGLPYATVHDGKEEAVEWVFQNFYVNKVGDGVPNNLSRDNSIGYTSGAVTVIVPRRNRGPIVQISGSTGLSVAYTGWGATSELESFRRINRATNLAEFQTALSYFDVGSQNFAYADVDGNIAYFTSAEAPLRTDLQAGVPGGGRPPWLIRDGSGALKHDWLPLQTRQPNQATPFEILPVAEMPQVINPASGYIANANNDPVGTTLDNNPLNQARRGGGIYYLNFNYSAYRMGRIDRALDAYRQSGQKVTAADMQKLQANNQLMDAELVSPYLTNALARAKAAGAWEPLKALAADAKVDEAVTRIGAWNFSTPTGVPEGFDPGDNPAALPQPGAAEIDASVAASLFAIWRSYAIRNTVDATLTKVGLAAALPDSSDSYTSLKFLLDNFAQLRGKGLSGVNFFALPTGVPAAPTPEDARDYLLLKSMQDGLARFASADFAPAFNGSTTLADYRWGKLHRIVFAHPLGGPFNLPGTNPYGFVNYSPALPGVPRAGGFDAVDASSHNTRANTVNQFMYSSGPARRFVGEMTPTIAASEIIPGGQSAVLGSPLYASQLGRWLTNNYHALPVGVAAATAAATSTQEFVP
ncbi:penicillin amidase [Tahibacter aquaticus]|uniref:Penicillin amidase n=1 Tax=Tahibacter aquaticus TaxID=520092 RepID=A0A4R6YS03_9GAMM|nr:penicillin acylase family protein [Tahibacter aquaticus]TDR40876.1 penicillin amidase [Tahibacter aquaticus]